MALYMGSDYLEEEHAWKKSNSKPSIYSGFMAGALDINNKRKELELFKQYGINPNGVIDVNKYLPRNSLIDQYRSAMLEDLKNSIKPETSFTNVLEESNKQAQNKIANKLDIIDQEKPDDPDDKQTSLDAAAKGMDIFGSTLKGLGEMSKMGLMWAQYAQNQELLKNQTNLVNEQIEASREYRQQRKNEIDRLNRARTYTKNAYGKGTTVTRSVM